MLANLALAAENDDVLSLNPGGRSAPLVPRNVPTSLSVLTRDFVWMPQNALPWGPRSPEERRLQLMLRLASELVSSRARAMIRISGAIPPLSGRRPTSDVLHNVLDEGFERAKPAACEPGEGFVSLGSAHGYRRFVPLVRGYQLYRTRGGRSPLALITTPGSPAVTQTLDELARAVPGLTHHPGSMSRDGALSAMAVSRGVVLSSSVEASPITLLEARALGRPVACSSIRAHDEMLTDDAMPRFDVNEASSVAQALHELDDHDGRAPHPLQDSTTRATRRAEWVDSVTGFLHALD